MLSVASVWRRSSTVKKAWRKDEQKDEQRGEQRGEQKDELRKQRVLLHLFPVLWPMGAKGISSFWKTPKSSNFSWRSIPSSLLS